VIHVHHLAGCAPTPLAHYLKALGVLRLVPEQADSDARGWWDGDRFRLATRLSQEELDNFVLHDYRPTPIVSPWNKGSGFFLKNDPGLRPVEASNSPRFSAYREGIKASRALLEDISSADQKIRDIKAETKVRGLSGAERGRLRNSEDYKTRLRQADRRFKQLKANLIPDLRLNWRGPHREWLDVAMVLESDGDPKYPALLGTGGNDGRLDFTNNFMKRLGELFSLDDGSGKPKPEAPGWVLGALWGEPVPGHIRGQPVGQYLPGTAGGANNANGPDSGSIVNPADFVLMLEGAIAFTSHAVRRFGSSESSRAASPFAVNASAAAYASASLDDESARGEQWMPLWSRPSSYFELRRLLAEGRAQVGAQSAREPLDLARAAKRLGTTRGIKAFQRYGYIERNGQTNLAVPLGRFDVKEGSEHLACMDDLDAWLRRLSRVTRDRGAPALLAVAEKSLVDSLIAVTEGSQTPEQWQRVLICLGEIEQVMTHGSGFGAGPIPRLRPEWVAASNDGSAEFRLALAFALQRGLHRERHPVTDPIRRHWLPLDPKRPQQFATDGTDSAARLKAAPEVVMHGRRGLDDAVALIERRVVEESQRAGRHLPLMAAPRASASRTDLSSLLSGGIDLDSVMALAPALMALDRNAWARQRIRIESPASSDRPDEAWLAIRLCTLPWPLRTNSGFELDIGTDPALIRRLANGDAASAVAIALRRLSAAGVRGTVRAGTVPPNTARLWAAAIAFPITRRTAERFLYRLDPSKE